MSILLNSTLRNMALECLSYHRMALVSLNRNAKLEALTKRNFIKSKMLWQYGADTTYKTFSEIEAENLLYESVEYEFQGSVNCCVRYQRALGKAFMYGDSQKENECIEALDFLLAKLIWQYGELKVNQSLKAAGFAGLDESKFQDIEQFEPDDEISKLRILIDSL